MSIDHPLFLYQNLDRTVPLLKDSARFRVRMLALVPENGDGDKVARLLKREAGIEVPHQYGYVWTSFYKKADIADVLTALTLTWFSLSRTNPRAATLYRESVCSAMSDEHLGYRMDERGRIQHAVDEEFSRSRLAVLAILEAPELASARAATEQAFKYLDPPIDTKAAVRSMFEAVEIVARQLVPAHKNLHAGLARGDLMKLCVPLLTKDGTEVKVLERMFAGLAEWVDGLHYYRHGQPNAAPPSEEFTVFALSTGSAYLRLMARAALGSGTA